MLTPTSMFFMVPVNNSNRHKKWTPIFFAGYLKQMLFFCAGHLKHPTQKISFLILVG
jgi:hypothetical protein